MGQLSNKPPIEFYGGDNSEFSVLQAIILPSSIMAALKTKDNS